MLIGWVLGFLSFGVLGVFENVKLGLGSLGLDFGVSEFWSFGGF